MKTALHIFKLIFLFIFSVSLFAAELTVVKTVPANGATNVDPLLTEVKIVFSTPVKMNSWSFVQTNQGEFPEIMDDPYFPDNRTCVLPVLLEPGRTYSIGINSATRRGFKSAADERITATPYVLTFTTGKSEDDFLQQEDQYRQEQPPRQSRQLTARQEKGSAVGRRTRQKTIIFRRQSEPRENAFSILVPHGWQTEGGIFRVDPTAQGGAAQSIAAKLDFAVKKDRQGSVMIRWLPDVLFFDMRHSPAGQMGLFPPGSNYNGMTVYPLMSALQFISQVAFPYAHPGVSGVEIVEQKPLPGLAEKYQQRVRAVMPQLTFSYDAGIVTVTYRENGINYKEKIFAVIENWGQLGAGMWGNKETFFIRAPVNEFADWEPVFSVIQNSVIINRQWLAGEIRGQILRGKIMINTQREIQRIDREIVEHRQKTNAEIHNDMFLTLTDQEEYVNPFTGEVEIGSNQWRFRWENEGGDIIYTNDPNYDPRTDVNLNRTDFKLTPVRKRFPR